MRLKKEKTNLILDSVVIQRFESDDGTTMHLILASYLGRMPTIEDMRVCSRFKKPGSRTEYFILYNRKPIGVLKDLRLIGHSYGDNDIFHVASFMPSQLLN